RIRCASARECTPSPGPYSAITRARSKSILLATRSTSACELGMIEAIWNGRFRNRLKKRTLIANSNSSPRHFACPAAKAGTLRLPAPAGKGDFGLSLKEAFDIDSSLYND